MRTLIFCFMFLIFFLPVHPHGNNRMEDAGAQALASLQEAPLLHTLRLNLSGDFYGIRDAGAQALASLKQAPLLQILSLDLSHNSIGDAGAEALASLKEAPFLHTLSLRLFENDIRLVGARALVSLKEAPLLHTLSLDLGSISLRFESIRNKSRLGRFALSLGWPRWWVHAHGWDHPCPTRATRATRATRTIAQPPAPNA